MSHNIEIRDGKASFVSARQNAWHQLGTVLPYTFTAEEALAEAQLADWDLRKVQLQAIDPLTGEGFEVPDQFGVLRNDGNVLGVVGNTYKIMQNEQLTGLLDALVDESGAHYETAGSLDRGRRVFVSMKLPNHMKIGGVDPVDLYLTAMTSHDGSSPTVVMTTPIRVVCENTLNLAMGNTKSVFKVRHTSAADRVVLNEARHALDVSFAYAQEFETMADQLLNKSMTQRTFEQIIDREFGAGPEAAVGTVTRSQNKVDEMVRLFADAETHEKVRDTAWAGLNAMTEWFDHFSPVRGSLSEADARARKTITDTEFKARALHLMQNVG